MTTLLCTTAAERVKTSLPEEFAISACFSLRLGEMHSFCIFLLFFSMCSVPLLTIIFSTWETFPISSVFALSFSCYGHSLLKARKGALGASWSLLGQRICFRFFLSLLMFSFLLPRLLLMLFLINPPPLLYSNIKCRLSHLRRHLCKPVSSELAVVVSIWPCHSSFRKWSLVRLPLAIFLFTW